MFKVRLHKVDGIAATATSPAQLASLPDADNFGWSVYTWTGNGGYIPPTLIGNIRLPQAVLVRLAAAGAMGGTNTVGVHPRQAGVFNPTLDGSNAALTFHVTPFNVNGPIRLTLLPGDGLLLRLDTVVATTVEIIAENLEVGELDELQ